MLLIKKILQNSNPVYLFMSSLVMYPVIQFVQAQLRIFNDKLYSLLLIGSLALTIYFVKKLLNDFHFENRYFKFIFSLFIIYEFILIARGIHFDYQLIKYNIQADFIIWPAIIPFVIFLDKDDLTFFYIIKSFYGMGVIFLFFSVIDPFLVTQRATAELFNQSLAFTCGFLFLNAKYVSKKVSWVAVISLIIGTLSFVYLARRSAMVSFGGLLLVGFYFFLRNLNASKFFSLIPLFAGFIILGLLSFNNLPEALTSKLNDRLNEDTRSDVFDNFFDGMKDDLVFGKGINGTYYFPIDEDVVTDDGVTYGEIQYRNWIENGYLQLLLTGGYVHIALFVLTLLPAALLGIFKSKNQLSRACGIVIFLWMLDMTIYGLPRLIPQYVLVWMCAGICYKASFRDQSDEEIVESFEAVGLIQGTTLEETLAESDNYLADSQEKY